MTVAPTRKGRTGRNKARSRRFGSEGEAESTSQVPPKEGKHKDRGEVKECQTRRERSLSTVAAHMIWPKMSVQFNSSNNSNNIFVVDPRCRKKKNMTTPTQ